MGATMGWSTRLSMAAAGTAIGSYTAAIEIVSESLKKTGEILKTSGMRGTRSHPKERTRDDIYKVGGQITMHPTPLVLDILLPRILGANESADAFALAETLPEFDILVDRGEKRFVYAGCKVNKATFRGRTGGLVELVLDIIGKTETESDTAFPTIAAPTDPPYTFYDSASAMTLLSSAREINDFELSVDNAITVRHANSQSATDLTPSDRIVLFNCTVPYYGNTDLHDQGVSGSGAASLVFTNGGYSTTFTMPALQFPPDSPNAAARNAEIVLALKGQAMKSSTTPELAVTHDSTA